MEKEERGPGCPQGLEELHGEDDTPADTGSDAAAPISWICRKPGGRPGRLCGGTVARNDDVDATERAEVRRLPCGRLAVGGGHHEHDQKDCERGSKRSGGERERKRNNCEDGRWEDGGLP